MRDAGPAERREHAEVGGEAGGEQDARPRCPSRRPARPRARRGRAGADDQPGRAGAGAPAVEGLVGGGHDRGVVGQAEVVVGRERDDRPSVDRRRSTARRSARPSARRPSVERRDRQRPDRVDGVGARSPIALGPAGRRSPLSSRAVAPRRSASASVSTMRSISSAVDGERRHEHDDVAQRAQQHAAARRRRRTPGGPSAARRPAGASSTPPMRPRWRTSRHRGQRRERARRAAGASCAARARDVGEHVPLVEQLEVAQGDRGGRGRSRCRSARGRGCARTGRRRGTPRTPGRLATVADIGR